MPTITHRMNGTSRNAGRRSARSKPETAALEERPTGGAAMHFRRHRPAPQVLQAAHQHAAAHQAEHDDVSDGNQQIGVAERAQDLDDLTPRPAPVKPPASSVKPILKSTLPRRK